MDLAPLTALFGWMTLLNTMFLVFASLVLVAGRQWVTGLHARLTGVPAEQIPALYFAWLGAYKRGVILFNLVPWLALLIVT